MRKVQKTLLDLLEDNRDLRLHSFWYPFVRDGEPLGCDEIEGMLSEESRPALFGEESRNR